MKIWQQRMAVLAGLGLTFAAAPAFAGFGVIGGVSFGLGTAKNELETVQSRSINVLELHLLPGYQLGPILIGPMGQYHITSQMTDPLDVGNTNVSSKGYSLGGGLSFALGPITLQGSYDFLGKITFDTATAVGDTSDGKLSGFTVILGYSVSPMVTLDAVFGTHSYSEQTIGGVTTDISTNRYKEMHYGLGLSFAI